MIEHLIEYIQSIIAQYGAWGVFFATLIEEIIAPIPSPLIPLAGGFFLLPIDGTFLDIALQSALIIALPVSIGISIGSSVVYALGYFGGKPVIEKTKKWTQINWHDIEKAEAKLTRGTGDEITLFLLRILPIVPGVAISGFCGIARYPFRKFLVISSIGAFIRAFILSLVGWRVGTSYAIYADMISKFEKIIFLVVGGVLLIGLGGYYIFKKRKAVRV